MPIIVNKNLDIQGTQSEQKRPLDYRYGPWSSLERALSFLNDVESENDKTYYGLTIGIYVYDQSDPTKVIGVDDYWWQPECIWDEENSKWIDGFVRKMPANSPANVGDKSDTGKSLGMDSSEHDYNAGWYVGGGGSPTWNILGV